VHKTTTRTDTRIDFKKEEDEENIKQYFNAGHLLSKTSSHIHN
jgi:hypothetical protein